MNYKMVASAYTVYIYVFQFVRVFLSCQSQWELLHCTFNLKHFFSNTPLLHFRVIPCQIKREKQEISPISSDLVDFWYGSLYSYEKLVYQISAKNPQQFLRYRYLVSRPFFDFFHRWHHRNLLLSTILSLITFDLVDQSN